jgi:hydroxymethylglutaryl-CoA reductase (NADPH)
MRNPVKRVLNFAGGMASTVASTPMQRAPALVFTSARQARAFRGWMLEHLAEIRVAAEAAASGLELTCIESHVSNNVVHLRLELAWEGAPCPETLASATYAACKWMRRENPAVLRYFVTPSVTRARAG